MADKKKKNELKMRSWYSNRYQLVLLQRNLLSLFTLLAMAAVVVAVIFLKKFTESKSFEPYVIEVEDTTGRIHVVENITQTRLTADETIKRYFLYTFLRAAEGYNNATFNDDRRKVSLLSIGTVFTQINSRIAPRIPTSPYAVLGSRGILEVKVKSIIFLTPSTAEVRFAVTSNRPTKEFPSEKHKIARIEFRFTDLRLNEAERLINPLGFQVTKYNADVDIITNN